MYMLQFDIETVRILKCMCFSQIIWESLCSNLDDNTMDFACQSSHLFCF